MNIVQGPMRTPIDQDDARAKRVQALGLTLEWSRSVGPEHGTRIPIEEFLDAVKQVASYLDGGENAQ